MNKICVLGSMNMDMVLAVKNLPKKGETLLVDKIDKIPGGKGANQAVAAKRLGGEVFMISKVGCDDNADILIDSLKKDRIDVSHIFKNENAPTGLAIITVDSNGDNMISVISGANMSLDSKDIDAAKSLIEDSNIIISQFETPIDMTIKAFEYAKSKGLITILNPAPAANVPDSLLSVTDIIIPNETEAAELTGITVTDLESAKEASSFFLSKGVTFTIVTLGSQGAALISNEDASLIPAYKVDAVDSTAAGDSFIGALSTRLSPSEPLSFKLIEDAIRFANKVSSITVTRKGAQVSLPTIDEVHEQFKEEI